MQEQIKWWQSDYWFLDNSYLTPIIFQNLAYPSVSHAFLASQTGKIDLRIKIAHSPLMALRSLVDELGEPESMFNGPNTMRKLLEYKFGYKQDTSLIDMSDAQSSLAKRLIATGKRPLVYGNRSCSDFYGVCECPKHMGKGKNVLGGLIMGIRQKLVEYVTKDVSKDQTCSCEKPNDAFFLYAMSGKLWLKPFCEEHQALAAMATARMDDNQGVFRFEKSWFLEKKDGVNKIVVPHHHHTIRPDVFDTGERREWEGGWAEWRRRLSSVPSAQDSPKLPKNITFYLSGKIT